MLAMIRCPTWMGLNEPKNNPIFKFLFYIFLKNCSDRKQNTFHRYLSNLLGRWFNCCLGFTFLKVFYNLGLCHFRQLIAQFISLLPQEFNSVKGFINRLHIFQILHLSNLQILMYQDIIFVSRSNLLKLVLNQMSQVLPKCRWINMQFLHLFVVKLKSGKTLQTVQGRGCSRKVAPILFHQFLPKHKKVERYFASG